VRARLRTLWDAARTSLWLIPSLMIVVGFALAVTMLNIDVRWARGDRTEFWWVNHGDGEDARNLLSTLLGATITMASMAFSVTVVALTLAASSYGSRLIRIFQADLRTQVTLGAFALTIVYCLIVLRSIHGRASVADVPHASVTLGTVLGFACVVALLFFISGVARSLVADEVVRRARDDIDASLAALPPLDASSLPDFASGDLPPNFENEAEKVALPHEGYVKATDYEALVDWATARNVVIRADFRAGDFIVEGDKRVLIFPPTGDPERVRQEIGRFIVTGDERTPTQDLEFSIRHLVEVAVRALSPGVNDPFTAAVAIDRLRGALSRLAGRRLPLERLRDQNGVLRLKRRTSTFEGLVGTSLHQIRQAGSSHPFVLIHMLEALEAIAPHTQTVTQRRTLLHHAHLIRSAGLRDVPEQEDRDDVERSFQKAVSAYGMGLPGG
jgi:uncharacterized membrane protein